MAKKRRPSTNCCELRSRERIEKLEITKNQINHTHYSFNETCLPEAQRIQQISQDGLG